jgi:hypothetical protein
MQDSPSSEEQAEDLQKQLADFKVAQSVQQATRDDPSRSARSKLAPGLGDPVAASHETASKTPDSYDWVFGPSVCSDRCLDNVETNQDWRMWDLGHLGNRDGAFCLESSGVERFDPEVNSDYRGMEKLAEAVKERQPSNKPDHVGRIAKVLRAGYRYMIDDENFKIVRTAQVKLFG